MVREAFYGAVPEAHVAQGLEWLTAWWQRTRREARAPAELARRMNAVNPKYVLRNYLAQEAIDAAHAGDDSRVHDAAGRDAAAVRRAAGARAYAAEAAGLGAVEAGMLRALLQLVGGDLASPRGRHPTGCR